MLVKAAVGLFLDCRDYPPSPVAPEHNEVSKMKPTSISSATRFGSSRQQWLLAATMATILGGGALLVADVRPAFAQTVEVVDLVKVAEGLRVSKLIGLSVTNSANDDIGKIDDLIVADDQVMYAILQIGGFLGLGGYLIAVPYTHLEIADGGTKILLSAGGTKQELQQTPEFTYGQTQQK